MLYDVCKNLKRNQSKTLAQVGYLWLHIEHGLLLHLFQMLTPQRCPTRMSAALYLPCMYASFSAIALLRSLISDNATNRLLIGGLHLLSGQSPDASPLLHPTNGIGRDRRVKELIWLNKKPARPVFLSFF